MIPVSAIVVTKNEERRIGECLAALAGFDEIVVVDSSSADRTRDIAFHAAARVVSYEWNGRYPKKRQWVLDNLQLKHERVFFVDADEIVTKKLKEEIAALDWQAAGYFVRGRYVFEGQVLRHGLANNKLALFDRRKIHFPMVNDLGLPGMGEIEGHYQPVLKDNTDTIGQLRHVLIHRAYDENWQERHERYAQWEAGMNRRGAWPEENSQSRNNLKKVFRATPLRPWAAFLHSYIFKLGFLDGGRGFRFALSRASYYRMISRASRAGGQPRAPSTPRLAADK